MTLDELRALIRNRTTPKGEKPAYVTIPHGDWQRLRAELEHEIRGMSADERPGNDIGLYEFTLDGVPVIVE